MISEKHRCLFVHIPKTGGKSVYRAFGIGWENHKDLLRYSQELEPEKFRNCFKFAIVRNPWERLVSEYNFQKKKRRSPESKLFLLDESGAPRDFASWVRVAISNPRHYQGKDWGGDVSAHIHRWSPQLDWISLGGRIGIDFVARLENIRRDFQQICLKLGGPHLRLPHRNGKFHWHYSKYYDAATRELVGDYYAGDIRTFGYVFENRSSLVHLGWQCLNRLTCALRHGAAAGAGARCNSRSTRCAAS